MLTTTHMLIGAAATTRPHFRPWQIMLGWLGAFAPDASVFLMVGVARVSATDGRSMWRQPDGLYWQEPWQTFSAISNSIPMWAVLSLIGFIVMRRSTRFRELGLGLLIFSAAALLHVLCDFPVHTDDAHVHFWPLTDWRFHSPVSYYQRSNYGNIVRPLEAVLGLGLMAFLIWRFRSWTIRILAVLMAVPPLLMQFVARMIF